MDRYAIRPHTLDISRFLTLWDSKRTSVLPARRDFSIAELRPYLGRIALLDVIDGGADFRFRLYGTKIAEEYQADMTRKSVAEFRPHFRDAIVPGYRRCFDSREPYYDVIEIKDEMMHYKWERVVLPLSTDGVAVNMLMVYRSDLIYERRN